MKFYKKKIASHESMDEAHRRLKREGSMMEKVDWWLTDNVEFGWVK